MQKPLKAAESRNSKKWFVIDQVGDNQFILTFTRKGLALFGADSAEIVADDRATIARYEKRQREIENERLGIVEKMASYGQPRQTFEQAYRTALDFLTNPSKLWNIGRIDDKRAVLRLVFAGPIKYVRNEGYRTAEYSIPIRVLKSFCA